MRVSELVRLRMLLPLAICLSALTSARGATLGQVYFQTSCQADVQPQFDHGIALLHSFEFKEAEQVFQDVEAKDSRCVIAAWGLALADTERSGANAPRNDLAEGWKQLRPWLSRKAGSEREQMYLDAVRAMYEGYDRTSGEVRWARYLDRMDAIRHRYPQDVNAALFYALGLVWTSGPGEKGLARRRRALEILLPIFQELPDNPGAAHYIIHAADTPQLAAIALPAARRYAAIAPDSPHALHMPSHIFNRLGMWQSSIGSNLASARVAEEWIKEGKDGRFDELHALNNLEYDYLQSGETNQARRVIAQIAERSKQPGGDPWAPIDAMIYYDVDTYDWRDALNLQPPQGSPFDENFDVYWIHTIAAARSGDTAEAESSLADFRRSSSEWIKGHGWGDVLHLALAEAEAWTLFAQGKREEAVDRLREAVRFERSHPMYYADILPRPSAEMLGDMLLQTGKRSEALAAYKAALAMAPNRFDSLAGVKACDATLIVQGRPDANSAGSSAGH